MATMQTDREWFARAASIYVDMERGIYDWGERKQPRHKDGSYRVLKGRILKDLGLAENYGLASERIWANPYFLEDLEAERRRRDFGLEKVVRELEVKTGPLRETRDKVITTVRDIFERTPDSEDPLALTPAQYVKEGREWIRYIDEVEGRFEGEKEATIESILAQQAGTNRITAQMMNTAMELLRSHRDDSERKLRSMGVIEGSAEETDE
jgi:hypothetical protein